MPITKSKFFAGLDLGQAIDPSALVIIEKMTYVPTNREIFDNAGTSPPLPEPAYAIRRLERWLGVSYPDQVARTKERLHKKPLSGNVTLSIDYTGCGRPVYDMFRVAKFACPLVPILIHGGDHVTRDSGTFRVPKRDLIGVTQVLLQDERLKIAATLPDAQVLVSEMQNFRVKINPATAHDSYAAWRENQHDDLIFATSMALWLAEHESPPFQRIPLHGI